MEQSKSDFQLKIEQEIKQLNALYKIKEAAEETNSQCVFKDCEWPYSDDYRFNKFSTSVLFQNVTFPEGVVDSWEFRDKIFRQSVTFLNCKFRSRFLTLRNCHFHKDVSFYNVSFPRNISIEGGDYKGLFRLKGCSAHTLSLAPENKGLNSSGKMNFGDFVLTDCKLTEIHIWDSIFKRRFQIHKSIIKNRVHINNIEVNLPCSFNETDFHSEHPPQDFAPITIHDCIFKSWVIFKDINFLCPVDFSHNHFKNIIQLDNTIFKSSIFFQGSMDPGNTEVRFNDPKPIFAEGIDTLYRFAKVAAHAKGDFEQESEFHYRERKSQTLFNIMNPELWRWPWNFKDILKNILHYIFIHLFFGYGEKPWRVLRLGTTIILLFGIIYYLIDAAGTSASSFWEYLYFSIVTFTTLGYGDLKPIGSLAQIFCASEALIGALLIAIFVVSLARKYSR